MADASYGCYLAQQKIDAEQAYRKMSAKEKVDFKRKMTEINKAGADDVQSPRHLASPPFS